MEDNSPKKRNSKLTKAAKRRKYYCKTKTKAYSGANFDFNPNNKVNFRNDLYHAMKLINKDVHINPSAVEIIHDFISQEMNLLLTNARNIAHEFSESDTIQKRDLETAVKLRFQSFLDEEELNYLLQYGERAVEYQKENH